MQDTRGQTTCRRCGEQYLPRYRPDLLMVLALLAVRALHAFLAFLGGDGHLVR